MEYNSAFESSNVSKIGYEPTNSTLEVEFKNGGTYHYYDVPEHIWEAFKAADSKGMFIHQNLKGQFRYSKV